MISNRLTFDSCGVEPADIIEHLQLIFIELPKFPVHSAEEKRLQLLWLRFLREINEKIVAVSQELLDVPEIAEAVSLVEESAYTASELAIYSSYRDQVRREKNLIRDKYVEGMAQGLAKGETLGMQKGLQQSIEQIALNMLKAGKPVEDISVLTGLPREAITQLSLGPCRDF